jgi:Acetoacetate decarboxylase (ADC)
MVDDTFFARVPQAPHPTSEGPVALPIYYRDASLFGVFFAADLAACRALVGPSSIEPWPLLGRAVVALFAWEYRDSTVGAYNEVGLGIQARRRGSSPSLLRLARDMMADDDQGIWVVNLPVTTRAALTAGVDLWGYPKYVTTIKTSFGHEGARVRVGDELELSLGQLHGPSLPGLPVVTYTALQGRLLRTVIEVNHRSRWGTGAGARLDLLGAGPTASSLRALGLAGKRPLASFRTDTFRARLPAGVDIGPA